MSFLLYEYSYCLNEWSPFDQVSRSFCDLTTRTRLLAYMKYPGNVQLNRLRGLWINSLTSWRSKGTVINCFTALRCSKECFSGPSNTSFFSHNCSKFSARHESNTTNQWRHSVVLAVLRWPPILSSTGQLRTAEKAVFAHCMQKKGRQCLQVRFKLYF